MQTSLLFREIRVPSAVWINRWLFSASTCRTLNGYHNRSFNPRTERHFVQLLPSDDVTDPATFETNRSRSRTRRRNESEIRVQARKMGLTEIFKESAERVKQLPDASNEDKLELYSLFKQSNMGDCNTSRPGGLFNLSDKAKWDAWNARKGMAQEEAMKAYINKVDTLCGTSFGSQV